MGAYIFLQGSFSSKKRVGAFCNHQHTKREKEKTEESPAPRSRSIHRKCANFHSLSPCLNFILSCACACAKKRKRTISPA
jgi:hypothetical protein